MQVSLAGIVVCAGLLLIGWCLRAPLMVALLASFAFGSTAVVSLAALGGSSPLIFTVLALVLLLSIFVRKATFNDLVVVFMEQRAAWIVFGLTFYVCLSAVLLPRLFAGQTAAFVPARTSGRVFEVPLAPVPGNVTQTCYFALGALTFLALSVLLLREANLEKIRRGFLAWCVLHAGLGLVDIVSKLAGAGDILQPIRTAAYALVTDVEEAGFSRIAGGYSEASGFGVATLAALAFAFTYWRRTRSLPVLALAIVLLVLLMLCTSTTAYVGLAIVSIPVIIALTRSMLAGRLARGDLVLLALAVFAVVIVLSIDLYDEHGFSPVVQLFESTILNKPLSASAQERAYWNMKSLQSFADTLGLGIGFGSSRSSSWIIAVVSQIGLIGALMVAALVMELPRSVGRPRAERIDPEITALHDSARACALAWLVGASIASGTADPGLLFFVALATVLACRTRFHQLSAGPMKQPRLRAPDVAKYANDS